MNGAPTGYAANRPTQNNIRPPRERRGATCDARMTDATPRTGQYKTTNGRNTPHLPTPNAANRLCRSGTGRHEWRPYGLRRKTADAKQHSTARIRRGATCDARMTDAKPQTGRHKTTFNRRKRTGATCDARKTDAMPRTSQYKTANRLQHATSADAKRGQPIVPFRHRAS